MTHALNVKDRQAGGRRSLLKWIAGGAAAALAAGMLVVAGMGAQLASAAGPHPEVSVSQNGTYLAGEDLSLSFTFTSDPAAGNQYNLSAGVVLSQDVTVLDSGTLGAPIVYSGRALPLDPGSPASRVQLPGNYSMSAAECTALGLEPLNPGQASGRCVVPDGKQYLVFQNISDLPEGASATHTITLRPSAAAFPVGSTIPLEVAAYTSGAERLIPVFPGSTGVAEGADDTSAPGTHTAQIRVNALRIEKSEPSPESELLRGVHANTTTYTLRVWHTGEGDIDEVTVTDFIPAGLEYLGLGGTDNTTNANGTQGGGFGNSFEYPGADSLTETPAPDDSTWDGPNAGLNAAKIGGETVETVLATAEDAAAHPGVVAGQVYTKVTWTLGELLAEGGEYSIVTPVAQNYADDAGEPGFIEIRYRAAVPLFENTLDFDDEGGQPGINGEQAANLDNNRGASTRHGSVQTTPGLDDDGSARQYTNVATVSGTYDGPVEDDADRALTDTDTETIDAVDVRLLKSVDDPEFRQGNLATYTLTIATSEYTSAELGEGGSADIYPNRLVDDLGDGICPVFPWNVPVTPGASTADPEALGPDGELVELPNLTIGDPNAPDSTGMTAEDWNEALGTALASACGFPAEETGAALTGTPGATTLSGIGYDPATGHFHLDLSTAPLAAQSEQVITYTALQNSVYTADEGDPGATTSGDRVVNTAELMMTTQSIPALDGVESASGAEAEGTWRAWDDSSATLEASLSELTKHVLKRSAGVPASEDISDEPESNWVKTPEQNEPFAIGDEVWYRIGISPPAGADVRNPKFTDFLPEGVVFDDADDDPLNGIIDDMWIVPSSTQGLGSCKPATPEAWVTTFVETPTIDGNVLTFELGSDKCVSGSDDRFLPLDTDLKIYLKVTVVDAAAFGTVDLPQNLAKYQQNNVDGDIFFLRDAAEIEVDGGPRLIKGIRSNTNDDSLSNPAVLPNGYPYNSDIDGTASFETVVQGDQVTFRLDVSAPRTGTTNYQIWDALPVGMTKADIEAGSYTAAEVTQEWIEPEGGTPGFWLATEDPVTAGWTATAYDYDPAFDSGAGGYPGAPSDVNDHLRAEIKDDERTIIVWSYTGPVPGSIAADDDAEPAKPAAFQGITLGYTVNIPDGVDGGPAAQLEQHYENDASIVQFAYRGNSGTPATPVNNEVIVNGSENLAGDRDPAPGVFELDDEENVTSNPSGVYVLGAEILKERTGSQIPSTTPAVTDGNNPADVFVEGETVNYTVSVTLPGNTTVVDGILKDRGALTWTGDPNVNGRTIGYELVESSVPVPATLPGGFDFDSITGVLTFPDEYTTGALDETFTIALTVRPNVQALNLTQAQRDQLNGKSLTNTGDFEYTAQATGESTNLTSQATATYRDPKPTLAKAATPGTVGANGLVSYTLTPGNTSGRPTLYDVTVLDCVPAEITVSGLNPTQGSANVAANACHMDEGEIQTTGGTNTGSLITWSFERLDMTPAPVLNYTGTVTPSAGGGSSFSNYAELSGYTLPETLDPGHANAGTRTANADETVDVSQATLEKSVTPTSAPVGDTVRYKLDVTLPANANFYGVSLTDTLPVGVSYVGNETQAFTNWATDPEVSDADVSGRDLSWTIDPEDIPFSTQQRTISIEFDARITSTVSAVATSVTNDATFAWSTALTGGTRLEDSDDATVTILNPVLGIAKDVKFSEEADSAYRQQASGAPDRSLTYRVRVTNTGNTPAHHITVTDTVPAGIVVQADTLSGGVLTGADPTTGGGLITWNLTGPIAVGGGNALVLTYQAAFAPSANLTSNTNGQGTLLTNTARVTHFESFPRDPVNPSVPTGRVYDPTTVQDTAEARALFPRVTLTKAAVDTSRTAYVGEPFEWVLTATNANQGVAQKVVLTDTLPANWTFTAVTSVTVAGVSVIPAPAPTGPAGGPLVWTFGSDAVSGSPTAILQPGQSIVVRYTATPTNPDALVTPGVGSSSPHTNTVSAVTTDRTNASSNQSRSHTGDPASDDAFLREADLLLVKEGIGGVTDPAAFDDLDEGSWIAGQGATTDYAQPQWRITVTNQGPDAGYGPFVVTDTMPTLPDGVTLSSWTARYYSGPSDTTGTDLGTFAAGSGTFTLGTTTTNLKADGSDRIVLLANVTIDATAVAAATPAAVELTNTASVTGRTYEDPDNLDDNTDSDTKPLDELADLAIAKEISSPVPPTVPAVGSAITWQITASNIGPSVSLSTAENPITITDTVPAGVTGVTATSNGDWVPTVTRDGDPSTFPAEAGDVVTWTYQGTAMPVGATASVSLAGTILSSHTGALTNAATVNPGDTPDPVTPNNTDEVTVTPNDSTTLTIAKSRVVSDGAGGWRQADPDNADDAFVAGDPVHYRITVTNNGPADARGVTVVDEVPTGLSYDTRVGIVGIVGSWGYASGGTTSTGTNAAWNTFTLSGTQVAGAPNATSFVVTYDTATTITGDVVNWAEVTADNWDPTDPSGPYDRDDDSTGSTRIVDLGIVKSHTGAGPFTPGTEVEYTLVVTNHGPSATNGVIEIEDSLPVGLSYVADSASVTVPAGTTAPADPNPTLSGTDDRVLTWELLEDTDTFDLNQTITVTFRALLDPTLRESATLTNVAIVDGPDAEPDPDPNPNRSEDEIETGPTSAVMTIGKAVEAGPWLAGTNVSYTLTVTNDGPSAVPASVTDTLPDGLTLVSMTGTNWDCSGVVAGELSGTCDYLDEADTNPVTQVLHPLGTSTITVVAYIAPSVLTGTSRLNEAVLTWNDGDGTHTDDDDEPIIVTTDGDLGIVKDVITGAEGTVVPDPAPATAGETVWYRLQVTNHGPSDAVGPITVTDTLPLGVSVPATLTSVGPWTVVPGPVDPVTGQTVVFTLADGQMASTATDVERGIAPVIEFEADLDPAIADGQLLTNEAEVSSPTPDSNLLNNEDEAVIHVGRVADLAIAKSHPSQPDGMVHLDEPLDFTILVTNNGPSVATGITVTDTVPVGLEVTSAVGPVLDADDNPTGWTIDSIDLVDPDDVLGGSVVVASYTPMLGVVAPDNEAAPLVLSTIVRESAYGTAPNHAEVAGNEVDPDLDNNEVDDPLDVRPRVTLVVEKTAVGEFQVGKTGTYRITVENLGPQPDPGPITVADVLPAGLTFHSSPSLPAGADLEVAGQTVTWTLPDGLAVDESATLTLVVNVLQAAYPSVTNVVTIDSPAEKTPESVLSDDETVTVKAVDPLAVTGGSAVGYLAMLAALLMLAGGVAAATRREKGRHAIAE